MGIKFSSITTDHTSESNVEGYGSPGNVTMDSHTTLWRNIDLEKCQFSLDSSTFVNDTYKRRYGLFDIQEQQRGTILWHIHLEFG